MSAREVINTGVLGTSYRTLCCRRCGSHTPGNGVAVICGMDVTHARTSMRIVQCSDAHVHTHAHAHAHTHTHTHRALDATLSVLAYLLMEFYVYFSRSVSGGIPSQELHGGEYLLDYKVGKLMAAHCQAIVCSVPQLLDGIQRELY